ncbi:hypothetical protein [Microvirus D_HF2_219]|nr:hypothetical protein [Microvirus D_HF2_219]
MVDLPALRIPNLRFEKIYDSGVYVIGYIFVDGIYICDFLVPSQLQIPTNQYEYKLYSSPTHGIVPLILDVPGRSMIEVHKGNTIKDSRGCFLVGYNLSKGTVSNSSLAMQVLRRNIIPADYPLLTNRTFKGGFDYVPITRP